MANKDYFPVQDVASAGLNTHDDPRDLATNESPEILNMDVGKKGRVTSRTGYEKWGDAISGATGGFRGLLTFYRTFGANSGDYLLSFHSNANGYQSTNTTKTPASIGSYGTDSGSVRGIVFDNMAIFGNGLAANTTQKWEGTGNSANLGGTPPDGKVWGSVNNCLLAVTPAAPQTIQWSDVGDPEAWAAGIASNTAVPTKNGGDVTAIFESNDQPMVFAEFSKHLADMAFDATDIISYFAFKEKIDSSGGCCATGSLQTIVNNFGEAAIYLSATEGFQAYGAIENFSDKRSPSDIGAKIKPTTDRINYGQSDVINSEYYEKKYICLVPFNAATKNNYAFVYNNEYGAWTVYNGMSFADITKFRDGDGRDQLIGASSGDPQLYKFNKEFSDDGIGYERVYRSKTWDFGNRTKFEWIDFDGSKSIGKDVYVDVYIDGNAQTRRKITDDNLIVSTGGGYVADNWVGDAYVGGGTGQLGSQLYQFRGRFPITFKEGQQIYFRIHNNSAGGGFSLQGYGIKTATVSAEVARNIRTGDTGYLATVS